MRLCSLAILENNSKIFYKIDNRLRYWTSDNIYITLKTSPNCINEKSCGIYCNVFLFQKKLPYKSIKTHCEQTRYSICCRDKNEVVFDDYDCDCEL